ncbi:MAG: MoaD/ThiS family protein [Fervidicoccaceae archaeon]
MASVTVRFYGRLIDIVGEKEITINDVDKLSDVYDKIRTRLGSKASALFQENGEPRAGIIVVINGEAAAFRGGKNARLSEHDRITFDAIDVFQVEGGG